MADRIYVKNECVDQRDGTRYFPGDEFPGPQSDQDKEVERLTKANCLTTDKPEASESSSSSAAPAEKPARRPRRGAKAG